VYLKKIKDIHYRMAHSATAATGAFVTMRALENDDYDRHFRAAFLQLTPEPPSEEKPGGSADDRVAVEWPKEFILTGMEHNKIREASSEVRPDGTGNAGIYHKNCYIVASLIGQVTNEDTIGLSMQRAYEDELEKLVQKRSYLFNLMPTL
jgi:hypothetical protein